MQTGGQSESRLNVEQDIFSKLAFKSKFALSFLFFHCRSLLPTIAGFLVDDVLALLALFFLPCSRPSS